MLVFASSKRLSVAVVIGLGAVARSAHAQTPPPAYAPPAVAPAAPSPAMPPAAPQGMAYPPGYMPPGYGMPRAPYGAPYAMPVQGFLPPSANAETGDTWRRNSPAMIGTGIGLISVGTLMAIIGSAVYSAGVKENYVYPTTCDLDSYDCFPTVTTKDGLKSGGIAMITIGTVALAVGIPVLLVGLKKVANTPPPKAAAFSPSLGVTRSGLSLRF